MKFVQTIIQHFNVNGTLDKRLLDKPPFNATHAEGIFGLFSDGQTRQVISLIDEINGNAEVG